MISKEFFTSKIGELALLLNGKYLTKEQEKAFYEKLKDENPCDFSKAIDDLTSNGEKLTFVSLRDTIHKYKYAREQSEIADKKRIELLEERKFIEELKNLNCQGGDCKSCKYEQYCPHKCKKIIADLFKNLETEKCCF